MALACRMSLPGPGVLLVTIGSTVGSKNIGCSRASIASSDSPAGGANVAPFCRRGLGRRGKRLRRALQHELARGQVVVGTVVDPEQLGVALDLGERRRVDALRMRDDLLEDAAHLERVAMLLVVEDVAAGDRRLVEMPDRASSRVSGSAAKPSAYNCTTAASSTRSRRYFFSPAGAVAAAGAAAGAGVAVLRGGSLEQAARSAIRTAEHSRFHIP